jgi:hypothetical protein
MIQHIVVQHNIQFAVVVDKVVVLGYLQYVVQLTVVHQVHIVVEKNVVVEMNQQVAL